MKKIKYLFTFIMMLLVTNNSVLAINNNNVIDLDKTGSATITLKESNNNDSIIGAELTIYQIANASIKDNNLIFTYHENIKECNGDLSDLSNINLANIINQCISEVNIPSQTKLTDEEGIVKFDNLKLGLYLIKQTNKVEGYSNIDPFLVMIPKEEDNKWVYDIKSDPKTDIIRLMDLTVEKVWNHSSSIEIHPKEVTIELYKGDQLIDTVILNKENNWTHTWKQIEKSDEYNVIEINIPNEYTASYRKEENKFIVTNTKTLVQTGMNLWLIEIIAGLGLIFIVLGIIFEKRNKYE